MKQQSKLDKLPVTEIPGEEMREISGGGLIDIVVKYVEKGITYCYNMGLNEALRYRKELK